MPARVEDLFRVQEGLCFLCGLPMVNKITKEHVHPRATSGYRMENNVVLSHGPCNGKRGCAGPTEDEIARATAIYAALGLKAFNYLPSLRERKHAQREGARANSQPQQ